MDTIYKDSKEDEITELKKNRMCSQRKFFLVSNLRKLKLRGKNHTTYTYAHKTHTNRGGNRYY